MDAYLDLLDEGVGWLGSDDQLQARNDAMQRFLESCGAARECRLSDIPLRSEGAALVQAFLDGDSGSLQEELTLDLATGVAEVRLSMRREPNGGCWVVVQDLTQPRQWMARALRADRLRVVGALGEGLLHDLNNVMGSLIGVADCMTEVESDDEASAFLHTVMEGTRTRGQILTSLYQFLHDQRVARTRVSAGVLIDDIENIFGKTALHAGVDFHVTRSDDLPDVRVVREHVVHAVLSVLASSLASDQGPIDVEIQRRSLPAEGGPTRSYVMIRILDHGDEWSVGDYERWHEGESFNIDLGAQSLLTAVASVHVHGGRVEAGQGSDGRRCLSIYLPALAVRA